MIYVGIDPGKTGGIAILDAQARLLLAAPMPNTVVGLGTTMRLMKFTHQDNLRVTLEYVRSMPGQGHVGAFTFGRGFGNLEGMLEVLGIRYSTVVPRLWQARFNCLTGGDKNISKARAQRMFPDIKMTHAIADALLIAE
nr:hypothetical protein [Betaproteobacteria bacterium]